MSKTCPVSLLPSAPGALVGDMRRMGEESRIIRLKRAIKAQQIKPRAATRATQVDPWGNRSRDSERA